MTVSAIIAQARRRLEQAGVANAANQALWMAQAVFDCSYPLWMRREAAPDAAAQFGKMLQERLAGRPLQHILGSQPFLHCEILTDPRALIPRPETERLAELAIERLPRGGAMLDIGTGSGAVAVAVARWRPDARITAVDISGDALILAQENAKRNGVDITFIMADLFPPAGTFDMIVSNPPYIATGELAALDREVARFEPHIALDGGPDGLAFYRRIAYSAMRYLHAQGQILLEVGGGQADAVAAMIAPICVTVEKIEDYAHIERIVAGRMQDI